VKISETVQKLTTGRSRIPILREWKFYLVLGMLLLVGIILRTAYLTADPPKGLTRSQDASTDPFAYTYFAENMIDFGDSNPFDDSRWIVYQKSTQTVAAYIVYSILGTGRAQGNLTSVILNLLAILFVALAIRNFGSRLGGIIFALLACLNFTLIMFARIPFLEASQNLWLSLSFYFFSKGRDRHFWYVFSGFATAAAAFFGKIVALYAGGLYLAVWAYIYFKSESDRKAVLRSALGFYGAYIAVGVFWLLYTYLPSAAEVSHYYAEQGKGLYGTPRAFQELHYFFWQLQNLLWERNFIDKLPIVTSLAAIGGVVALGKVFGRRAAKQPVDPTVLGMAIVLVWLVFAYVALFPFNYRPLRYQTTLMIPMMAIGGFLLAFAFDRSSIPIPRDKAKKSGRKTGGKQKSIVPFAVASAFLLLPVLSSAVLALGSKGFEQSVFQDIYLVTLLILVIGFIAAWLSRLRFWKGILTRNTFQIFTVVVLVVYIGYHLFAYVSWVGAREYTLITADRDIGEILSDGAVVSGSYGSALTQENKLGCIHHQFGVKVPDKDFFRKFPITHIAVDPGNEKRAQQDYASLMAGAQLVSTYVIRGLPVKLYRISEMSPNADAKTYRPSEFEDAMAMFSRNASDSAVALLDRYVEKGNRSYSAEMTLADVYSRARKYPAAFEHFRRILDLAPLDGYAAYLYGMNLLNAAVELREPAYRDSALVYLEIAAPRLAKEERLQKLVRQLRSELR
jgi:lysylphosphatidylglycerol synthetase-like protein (DUF2156 family)